MQPLPTNQSNQPKEFSNNLHHPLYGEVQGGLHPELPPTRPSETGQLGRAKSMRLWQGILYSRWWLGLAIGLTFILGQTLDQVWNRQVLQTNSILSYLLLWGTLGSIVVWFSLTWANRRERHYQTELHQALEQQQWLNRQLQRTNAHLGLLSEVNHKLTEAVSVDEVAVAALDFTRRLVNYEAAALWLLAPSGEVLVRTSDHFPKSLHAQRAAYANKLEIARSYQVVTAKDDPEGTNGACITLPLMDGVTHIGRLELFLTHPIYLVQDEQKLLLTIGTEIAQTITSARRRAREERDIYELEQAIAEERARIARDIHDGLAQTLAFRRMRVDLWLDWLDQDPERLRGELLTFKQVLREQIGELRRAIFALRPLTFDELGFVGGMHRYIHEFGSQQNWVVDANLSNIGASLAPTFEAICFRIVQEALTNAAKHAQATAVNVRSEIVDDGLQIIIQDNGKGFDPNALEMPPDDGGTRLGLRQMRERLDAIHGRLTVISAPGAGTEVRVWLPQDAVRRFEGEDEDTNQNEKIAPTQQHTQETNATQGNI